MVKTLSKVPVLHQTRHRTVTVHPPLFDNKKELDDAKVSRPPEGIDLLLIGASTGGPPVISGILERLPKPCPMPTIVVQHITKGFAVGFSEWLGQASGHPTTVVDRSVMLNSGTVYIASDDANLVFTSSKTLRSRHDPELRGPRPNIDRLFISAADYSRPRTVALVLTGMGSDGAQGLAHLKRAGATVAVQDPETCVVDSMPKSAIEQGVEKTLTPDEIVRYLNRRLEQKSTKAVQISR
jgi:chemotaxis response regulator CheB